jgi:hypothetical protein
MNCARGGTGDAIRRDLLPQVLDEKNLVPPFARIIASPESIRLLQVGQQVLLEVPAR